jgi:P-type Cu2+ transporter
MIALERKLETEHSLENVDDRHASPTAVAQSANEHHEANCDHCGLASSSMVESNGHLFCCHGCMGAFALIHEMGLDDYYALREGAGNVDAAGTDTIFKQKAPTLAAIEMLKDLEGAGVDVHQTSDGLCEVRLTVEGLHCAACSWLIERMQPSLPGVHSAQVRMNDRSIHLVYDPKKTNPSKVASRLAPLGYLLLPQHRDDTDQSTNRHQQREHLIAIAVAAFLAANAMWIGIALYAGEATGMLIEHTYFFRWIGTILGVMAAIFPGRIFFRSAINAVRTRTAHVDIPIAMALAMGIAGSVFGTVYGNGHIYFDSLASLVLLLRVGRYIQFRSQYVAGLSLEKLFRWTNGITTRVAEDGSLQSIAASQLKPRDIVLVQPGETLPSDGFVVQGRSHLNVSWLTGESAPQSISMGDRVVGGTMNIDSPIQVCITECGKQSRLGQLEEVIRNAAGDRTPLVRAADKIGKWFVIMVLLLAIGCWIGWYFLEGPATATMHTVALLTIACPCAIALAAPLVITIAIGRAARQQIWIRDGQCLERLAKPGLMWFDKTGTLTEGNMRVQLWDGSTKSMKFALAVESQLNHPIAKAICEYAQLHVSKISQPDSISTTTDEIRSIEGLGVSAKVDGAGVLIGSEHLLTMHNIFVPTKWKSIHDRVLQDGMTPIWIAIDGKIEAIVSLSDSLRHDTIESLKALQLKGWRLGILSGDRKEVVDYWRRRIEGSGVAFEQAIGEASPEQKVDAIRLSLENEKAAVVFVGDGINDAAALAVADVGIAIRGGSEISLRAAPIYVASNRLRSIEQLVDASSSTLRTIQKCFGISLIYNSITISLAVVGLIHPLIAAIFMPISGLTVLGLAIAGHSFEKTEKS